MREQCGGVVSTRELMKGNTLFQYTHTTHTPSGTIGGGVHGRDST